MKANTKAKLKKLFVGLFYAAVIIFIVKYFMELDFSVIKEVEINWIFIVFSTMIRVCSLLILPISWQTLLNNFTVKKLTKDKLYVIYAKSWLGRYIPGKIAWVGGKIYFATQEKIDTNVAVITSFLDAVLQVFSCMLVGGVFFIFTDTTQVAPSTVTMLYIITAVMILFLIPPVFNRIVSLMYRILKRKPMGKEYWINTKTLTKGTGIVVLSKLISGIGTSCIVLALYPNLTFSQFVFSVGVFSVSTAIGMAALFAPAGIGVKESMQLLLLSVVVPKEIGAITVALVSIQSVFIDLAFYVIAKIIFKFESPIKKRSEKV